MVKYKENIYGNELRKELLSGVQQLSKAVKATLGPKGRNVTISREFSSPLVTKDGVTVAKEVKLKNRTQNTGVDIAKEAALKTGELAGDGTTTSIVLAEALFSEGLRLVEAGNNPTDIIRGMEDAKKDVIDYLNTIKISVSDKKEIGQVATISANNDKEIGTLISDAMESVGKNGVIAVEDGKGYDTSVDIEKGMQWDRGYLSPYFITNKETARFEKENAFVLISQKSLNSVGEVLRILEYCAEKQKSLVIIAPDVAGELLPTLAMNNLKGNFTSCAIKAPSFGDTQNKVLEDIAIATGAKVINDIHLGSLKLENIGNMKTGGPTIHSDASEWLGSVSKITVSKDTFTILNETGHETEINERVEQLKSEMNQSDDDRERSQLEKRIAKLVGAIALIRVGAASEVELKEKKARVEDAVAATKAAVEDGVVAGGGIALVRASQHLNNLLTTKEFANDSRKVGYKLIADTITAPLKTIAENGGVNGEVVLNEVLRQSNGNLNYGYNSATDKYEDLVVAGVIDPVLVTKTALENSVSVSKMLITTECTLIEVMDEKAMNAELDPSNMVF